MNAEELLLEESDYEAALRSVFPALYQTALEISHDEAEAAFAAQWAFVEAWSNVTRADPEPASGPAH